MAATNESSGSLNPYANPCKIVASSKEGVALKNEMSNYTNSLRSIRDVLLDNENYTSCPLYKMLRADIQRYIDSTIARITHENQPSER